MDNTKGWHGAIRTKEWFPGSEGQDFLDLWVIFCLFLFPSNIYWPLCCRHKTKAVTQPPLLGRQDCSFELTGTSQAVLLCFLEGDLKVTWENGSSKRKDDGCFKKFICKGFFVPLASHLGGGKRKSISSYSPSQMWSQVVSGLGPFVIQVNIHLSSTFRALVGSLALFYMIQMH